MKESISFVCLLVVLEEMMDILLANAPGTEPGNLRTERRSSWVLSSNNPQTLQVGAPERAREWTFNQTWLHDSC